MIVQPNFLDHWKTRLLQNELGDDPLAHTYVLRLWGHCQEQKTHRFPGLSAGALAAICRFKSAPEALWLALQAATFITVKNNRVDVHQWDEYNAGLITSWKNGKRGGRPKKTRSKPKETRGLSNENPLKTDREDGIEKIDKIGSNTNTPPPSVKDEAPKITAEMIYEAYPRKQGKQDALKAISKAIARIAETPLISNDPTWLLQRTVAYAEAVACWPEEDKQYCPHPATWYNRGSYEDDPGTWRRLPPKNDTGHKPGWNT